MSDMQMGTRGMSSSDLTRLKRLRGARASVIQPDLNEPIYSGTPPNNTVATTFVLGCIDPRYTAALEERLLEILSGNTYDLFVLAGAAGGGNLIGNGACGSPAGTCAVVSTNWQTALIEHIQVAITLHNVTKILVVDHLDCGAYKNCVLCTPTDQNATPHKTQFDTLKSYINGTNFYANSTNILTAGSAIFTGASGITGLYFDTPSVNPNLTTLRDYNATFPPGNTIATEFFPTTTGAKVLVLGCIDPRFSALLSSFLVNYKDVQFIYDLFILAGASLGANQSYTTFPTTRASTAKGNYIGGIILDGTNYIGNNWGPTFFDHLAIAILLHQITEVWVFDHLDCGAYKAIKFGNLNLPDEDPTQHTPELVKLQGYIKTAQPALAFKGFIMDKGGNITKVVDDNRGISLDTPKSLGAPMNKTLYSIPKLIPRTTGGSRIRFTASQYTALKAFYSADRVSQRQAVTNGINLNGKVLTATRVCNCTTSNPKKQGLCPDCS